VVRSIVTDVITDATAHDLLTRVGRDKIVIHIEHRIAKQTDVRWPTCC